MRVCIGLLVAILAVAHADNGRKQLNHAIDEPHRAQVPAGIDGNNERRLERFESARSDADWFHEDAEIQPADALPRPDAQQQPVQQPAIANINADANPRPSRMQRIKESAKKLNPFSRDNRQKIKECVGSCVRPRVQGDHPPDAAIARRHKQIMDRVRQRQKQEEKERDSLPVHAANILAHEIRGGRPLSNDLVAPEDRYPVGYLEGRRHHVALNAHDRLSEVLNGAIYDAINGRKRDSDVQCGMVHGPNGEPVPRKCPAGQCCHRSQCGNTHIMCNLCDPKFGDCGPQFVAGNNPLPPVTAGGVARYVASTGAYVIRNAMGY